VDIVYDPRHRRSPLVALRRLRYAGFELDREIEPLETVPEGMEDAARAALVEALITGSARHPHARAVRVVLERLGELHRRAGGDLPGADGAAVRTALGERLRGIRTLDEFMRCDLTLALGDFVSAERRHALEALPAWVEVAGDRCPLDYEIEDGKPVARVRMREHLARRLRDEDIPRLDRPVGLTVIRGKHEAVRAWTVSELRRALSAAGRPGPRRSASAKRRHRRP
jgi:hypothetical protein